MKLSSDQEIKCPNCGATAQINFYKIEDIAHGETARVTFVTPYETWGDKYLVYMKAHPEEEFTALQVAHGAGHSEVGSGASSTMLSLFKKGNVTRRIAIQPDTERPAYYYKLKR